MGLEKKIVVGTEYANIPIEEYKRLLEESFRLTMLKDLIAEKDRSYIDKGEVAWIIGLEDKEDEE